MFVVVRFHLKNPSTAFHVGCYDQVEVLLLKAKDRQQVPRELEQPDSTYTAPSTNKARDAQQAKTYIHQQQSYELCRVPYRPDK